MPGKTRSYATAHWIAALVAMAPAFCFADPTAESMLRAIEARGARSVLTHLTSEWSRFETVCDLIETGDLTWLEVARRLKPASDAATSLSLNYSVARAMLRAPERVLTLIGNGFTIGDVCTSPYIEPDPGVAENYQREAAALLGRVRDAKFARVGAECLAQITQPLARTQ